MVVAESLPSQQPRRNQPAERLLPSLSHPPPVLRSLLGGCWVTPHVILHTLPRPWQPSPPQPLAPTGNSRRTSMCQTTASPVPRHRRGHPPPADVLCSLHPCPRTCPLHRPATCWGLAEWGTIRCPGSPPPGPGVPFLSAVLAWSPPTQCSLLLPRVSCHS